MHLATHGVSVLVRRAHIWFLSVAEQRLITHMQPFATIICDTDTVDVLRLLEIERCFAMAQSRDAAGAMIPVAADAVKTVWKTNPFRFRRGRRVQARGRKFDTRP